MSIVVFFIDLEDNPQAFNYPDSEFSVALEDMNELRKMGARHVCISSELDGMVGKPGVDAVVDGKNPDGSTYDWSKAGRAGRVRDINAPVRNDGETS